MPVARALAAAGLGASFADVSPEDVGDQDVRWLLQTMGSYIVEDLGPGERSVFRPFHELLAAHLREEPQHEQSDGGHRVDAGWRKRRTEAESAITRALLDTLSLRWQSAHPYIRNYLVQHAAGGEPQLLPELLADVEFLAVAAPSTLVPLLSTADPRLRDVVKVYRRAFPLLGDDPQANLAYLLEAAAALHVPAPVTGNAGMRPTYRTKLASVRRDDSVLVLTGHSYTVTTVAFGVGEGGRPLLASGGHDKTVRLWDPDTGAAVGAPLTGHIHQVNSVAFGEGADGRPLLASGSNDNTVRLWDPGTGALAREPLTGHTGAVNSVAWGRLGDRGVVISGSDDQTVRFWDPDTGVPVGWPLQVEARAPLDDGVQKVRTHRVTEVTFGVSSSGQPLLVSATSDRLVHLWDLETGVLVGKLPGPGGKRLRLADRLAQNDHVLDVTAVALGHGAGGQPLLASARHDDATVWLSDLGSWRRAMRPLVGHTAWVQAVAFGLGAAGRPLLASASRDGTVRLWDPDSGAPIGRPLVGHTGRVEAVAFGVGAGGQPLLASGGSDGTVRLWDPHAGSGDGEPVTGHSAEVSSVAVSTTAGGQPLLASGSRDGTVRLWDPVNGTSLGQPLSFSIDPRRSPDAKCVESVAFGVGAGGRRLLASGNRDGTVRLWDPDTGGPVGEPLTGHRHAVTAVAFGVGARGRPLLASGSDDETVRLWDPDTGAPLGEPLTYKGQVLTAVAFGAGQGGRPLLAASSWRHSVQLWDPDTGARVGSFTDPSPRLYIPHTFDAVAFGVGPAGRPVLAAGGGDTVWLWDLVTGDTVGRLTGHTTVKSVAWGRIGDSSVIVSGGSDRTVRLWDPATGSQILMLRRRTAPNSLAVAHGAVHIGDDEGVSVLQIDQTTITASLDGGSLLT